MIERSPRRLPTANAVVAGILIGALAWWLRPGAPVAGAADGPDRGGATRLPGASRAPLLAATRAGSTRIVAVGEHGVVLLSDDGGAHWRQAGDVPTRALLTGVSFVDDRQGWAVGHDGVILHSTDGGEHWLRQREELGADKPLMAVRFTDAAHGLAVGLFGLALRTADGGATWTETELVPGSHDDKHLYALFGNATVSCIAAEAGAIFRSADQGATWTLVQTANRGSFWAGLALADGTLLAAGQRGHVFASHDQGLGWTEVASGTQQSLTAIAQDADGSVLITGLAGTTLRGDASAHAFTATARTDRQPLTVAITGGAEPRLFGTGGVVDAPATAR